MTEESTPPHDPSVAAEPSSIRLTVVLTAVCAISALLVSIVTSKTEAPIAAAKEAAHKAMLRQVLPSGVSEPEEREGEFRYYEADGAIALEVETEHGYAGKIRFLVGFDSDGALYSFKVLEHTETPGLGANLAISGNSLLESARGKRVGVTDWRVKKDGGELESITAATISSRAACEALALASERVEKIRRSRDGQ